MTHSQVEEVSVAEVCVLRADSTPFLKLLKLWATIIIITIHSNDMSVDCEFLTVADRHVIIHKASSSFIYLHSCIIRV